MTNRIFDIGINMKQPETILKSNITMINSNDEVIKFFISNKVYGFKDTKKLFNHFIIFKVKEEKLISSFG